MATRDITPAAVTAATAAQKYLLAFVELDFVSGFVRVTNAGHSVDWDGHTWVGIGALGAITEARESLSVEAIGMTFALSGVDPSIMTIVLSEQYQGRSARLWLSFIDAGVVVADPTIVFSGRMDTMQIQDGPTATISVTAESRFASWSRPQTRRFSDSDQQQEFPGDLGLQYIAELASGKEIIWGRT